MKKTVFRLLVVVMAVAVAFAVVHLAVQGNNSPADTEFTFALDGDKAILTGATDPLSGAVLLPDTVGGHTVVGIGENAFKDCADVTAFFLPSTITTIGAYAFENCSGLLQAILPNGLVSIGDGAFMGCSGLVSVTVPATVRSIGSCAFYRCDALESLVVPGVSTPVRGIFNVALDIGQTLAIGNPARQRFDACGTTVYCYENSVAYYDVIRDSFCAYDLLVEPSGNGPGNLTSYTIRYTDTADANVAAPVTLNVQPIGIHVAAVATIPVDEELGYPETAAQTIELSADAAENTITFVYPPRPVIVTFDAQGGTADFTESSVSFGGTYGTLPGAAREGYTFLGWFTADGVKVEESTTVTESGDHTLYADWEINKYTVTVETDGNGTAEADPAEDVAYGALVTLTAEANPGFTFDAWQSEDVTVEDGTFTMPDKAVVVRAVFTPVSYTVTFDTDGGNAKEPLTYATTDTTQLGNATRSGYSFRGWKVSVAAAEGDYNWGAVSTLYGSSQAVNGKYGDVTLKATWKAISYTIAFDANGGEGTMEPINTVYDAETVLTACAFERTDHTFLGWALTSDATETSFIDGATVKNLTKTANDTVTLYAVWSSVEIDLAAAEGSTTVIDRERNFIYGLKTGVTKTELLTDYLEVVGDGTLTVLSAPVGTGTKVELRNASTNELVATYTLIIFGDVNGDGLVNSSDVTKALNMCARLESRDISNPNALAADVSVDGIVNATDLTVLRALAVKTYDIDQVTREVIPIA